MRRFLIALALAAALAASCRPSAPDGKGQETRVQKEPGEEAGASEEAEEEGEDGEGEEEEASAGDDVWTEEQPLQRSFFKAGFKFYKGCQGELGMPAEAFLKLVAVNDDGKTVLPRTDSLKGYVTIDSADKALAYVRLFTDLETHYLFEDSHSIEVRPTDSEETGFGELPRAEFEKLELKQPTVRRDGDAFIVTMAVLDSKNTVYLRTEKVSEDGTLVILKEKEVASGLEDLYYPNYE